uniref:Uncharacterized protein n=1 Tax=candidate division CPR3 bacterium TaxID=2268181 RepID=A0A7C4M126_UNCC3
MFDKEKNKRFIRKCIICNELSLSTEDEDGIHQSCFPTKVSIARCSCGSTYEVPNNDLKALHKGIKVKKKIPDKILFFLINICPNCDLNQKSTDISATYYYQKT